MRILAGRLPPAWIAGVRQAVNPAWRPSDHAEERMIAKGVTSEMLRGCLESGRIVEVHDDAGTLRALIRDAVGVCAIVDFQGEAVVTCYRNEASDRHGTLDRSAYYWGPIGRKVLDRMAGGVRR